MIKDYNELSYDELRGMFFCSTLEHEKMTQEAYEVLLRGESGLDKPNITILELCTDGLKKYDDYSQLEDAEIFGIFVAYNVELLEKERNKWKEKERDQSEEERDRKAAYVFFREMLLAGKLDSKAMDDAGGPIFQFVLDCEMKLDNPDKKVIKLCNAKLKKNTENPKRVLKIHERIAIAASFAVIVTIVAFSYVNHYANFLKNVSNNGNEVISSDDIRTYSSMNEMLETEKLNILYPAKLPDGYTFTDFRVDSRGAHLEIQAYAKDLYVEFYVEVGTSQISMNSYSYKTNGIEYNIDEMPNGNYQAWWFYNDNYYSITVNDKAILSKIIENLTEG